MQIKVSSFEEDLPQSQFTPAAYAIATAREKARSVAAEAPDATLVIAADTVRACCTVTAGHLSRPDRMHRTCALATTPERGCSSSTAAPPQAQPISSSCAQRPVTPLASLPHEMQVVDKDGAILEKAEDEAEATRMLSMLAGTTHQVHTGDCTLPKDAPEQPNTLEQLKDMHARKRAAHSSSAVDMDAWIGSFLWPLTVVKCIQG